MLVDCPHLFVREDGSGFLPVVSVVSVVLHLEESADEGGMGEWPSKEVEDEVRFSVVREGSYSSTEVDGTTYFNGLIRRNLLCWPSIINKIDWVAVIATRTAEEGNQYETVDY